MSRTDDFDGIVTHDSFFKKLNSAVEPSEDQKKKEMLEDQEALLTFLAGNQLMSTDYPKQDFLLEGFLPDKGLICLSGMPSSYKSWFSSHLALTVLKGGTLLDRWKAEKGAVLFIDKENIEAQIQQRMRMLGAGDEMKDCYFVRGNFTTDNLNSLAMVVQFIKEKNIKLVIIDSLVRVHSRNENEAVEMNKVFERLSEFQAAGATVLYLHHLRKATSYAQDPMERLRGSIDISARLDSLIAFENERNMITVIHGKSRYVESIPSFVMEFVVTEKGDAKFTYVRHLEEGQLKGLSCERAIMALLMKNSYTKKYLIEVLNGDAMGTRYGTRTIEEALKTLLNQGKIVKNFANREVTYSLNKLKSFIDEEDPDKIVN